MKRRGIPLANPIHKKPTITITFSIIIARFLPKYSHVRPPPIEPTKEPITYRLAKIKIY
jgi:hypothetical protein